MFSSLLFFFSSLNPPPPWRIPVVAPSPDKPNIVSRTFHKRYVTCKVTLRYGYVFLIRKCYCSKVRCSTVRSWICFLYPPIYTILGQRTCNFVCVVQSCSSWVDPRFFGKFSKSLHSVFKVSLLFILCKLFAFFKKLEMKFRVQIRDEL